MKVCDTVWFGGIALVTALLTTTSSPAQSTTTSQGEASLKQAAADNKTSFLVFYRDWDAAAEAMASVVKAQVNKQAGKAIWAHIRVTEPAERSVVEKFQVSRAPMPMLLAVHPNGAVTGALMKQVTEANLSQCLVSPKKAACMKLLQDNQLVLLCVLPTGQQSVPQGARDLQADPHFAKRTGIVTLQRNDPNEAAFIAELKVDPQTATPLTVFMSPPGVLVGTFPVTASKNDLAAALASAGKCCSDPNCKHNPK